MQRNRQHSGLLRDRSIVQDSPFGGNVEALIPPSRPILANLRVFKDDQS